MKSSRARTKAHTGNRLTWHRANKYAHTTPEQALVLEREAEPDPIGCMCATCMGASMASNVTITLAMLEVKLAQAVDASLAHRIGVPVWDSVAYHSSQVSANSPPASQVWLADELADDLVRFLAECDEGGAALAESIVSALPASETECLHRQIMAAAGQARRHLLLHAVLFSDFWVRMPSTWNQEGGMSGFYRHIFCLYETPACLTTPSELNGGDARDPDFTYFIWFLLFAQGGSLERSAAKFGWEIPAGVAGNLRQINKLEPWSAWVHAWVQKLGGSTVEGEALLRHSPYTSGFQFRISHANPNVGLRTQFLAFVSQTVHWLAANRSDLTPATVDLILPWALHLYTEAERERGAFSWKGRSLARTLLAAQEYTESCAKQSQSNIRWPSHGLDWAAPAEVDGYQWLVRELNSSLELFEEGRTMSHCVAAYCNRCVQNVSAIFSLTKNNVRQVTIEMEPATWRIVQARGKANRLPFAEERSIISAWTRWVQKKSAELPNSN